jgi:hypothetical protein
MKKIVFWLIAFISVVSIILLSGCSVVESFTKSKNQKTQTVFTVKDEIVYLKDRPVAIYQAKTFSLDNGELVEEYNLLMTADLSGDKQIIGDLIDFISDRHQGAEVEIEVQSKNSPFQL